MDIRYLAERYQRGVSNVEEFMQRHQRYEHFDNLTAALPDFLSMMQNEGGNKLLGLPNSNQCHDNIDIELKDWILSFSFKVSGLASSLLTRRCGHKAP